MSTRVKKFFFDSSFAKLALSVAIPLMFQQLITSSVNLVDNLMVGQLGDAAIGAVASVNRFYIIATYGTNGLVNAAAIFVAQFFGANNSQRMKESFRCMIVCSLVVMSVFCAIGLFLPELIVGYFTADQEIIVLGAQYLRIIALSFIPMALTMSVANSMRCIGETKIPLRASAIAVITNTILNYCLIFGNFGFPRLGIQGAAYATLFARCFEMVLILHALYRNEFPFKTSVGSLIHIPFNLFKQIILKALPLAFNEVMWSLGIATLFKFYSTRGPEVMSGYSIGNTIGDIFFVLFAGMATASTVLISQPLGANKLDEAKKHAYQLIGFSVVLSFVFAILMFSSSFAIPFLYSNISMEAKHVAVYIIRIQSCMFWIYMATTECYFILRAGGDTKHTLIMDSGFMWLVNIPVVAIFTYFTKVPYIYLYLIGQTTDLFKLAFSYRLVSKEKWVRNLTHLTEE